MTDEVKASDVWTLKRAPDSSWLIIEKASPESSVGEVVGQATPEWIRLPAPTSPRAVLALALRVASDAAILQLIDALGEALGVDTGSLDEHWIDVARDVARDALLVVEVDE